MIAFKKKKMIAFNIIIIIFGMLSSGSNAIQPRYHLWASSEQGAELKIINKK